jgi:glycosyltransferase involved in cell wall biosynthesis
VTAEGPRKISIVVNTFAPHGILTVVETVARELGADGWDVELVAQRAKIDAEPAAEFARRDLACGRLALMPIYLHRYLKERKPDLLITTHLQYAAMAAMAPSLFSRRTQTKLIGWEHIDLRAVERPRSQEFRWRIVKLLSGRVAREAIAYVAVSDGVRDSLSALGIENAAVVPNPGPSDLHSAALLNKNPLSIAAAGRLETQKDFDGLLEAFALVLAEEPNASLTIFGEGSLRSRLQEQAGRLGIADRVHLPGWSEDLVADLCRFGTFVLSSVYEGFGLVLLEALAAGCRVVSTDAPSGPRQVLRDGEFGELVPVGSPVSLANAILASMDAGPVTGEEVRSRLDYLRTFDERAVSRQMAEILHELVR